ncbi:MAG: hypothetical protein QOI41_3654 [Myxococcales bacterium]|nr:hypothetical protein [Myxococcales bacterium]
MARRMHPRRRSVGSLFRPSANSVYWTAIGAVASMIIGLPVVWIAWARAPYATGREEPAEQPVKFDHRHHVRDNGMDCLYCHAGAESSSYAGVPPTALCMGCHNQIWTDSPELSIVRETYFSGKPLRWQRVNRLPDFVFFDHSIHVQNGVGCVTCHGRVDEMGQVYAAEPLTMRFCLDCHRASVRSVTDCSGCHR